MRPLKRIVGHIARTSSVQALGRWHRGNPLILMYHGVTRATSRGLLNCEGKHVELDRFVEQVRFVKRHRRVMSLDALVSGVVTGADMRGAVAITFDDGYENNVAHAAPALADLGVPASFFLATGYIDADRWMWVDRLEFALNHTARGALDLDGMGHVGLDEKREALRAIKRYAKQQPQEVLSRLVAQVDEQCGVSSDAPSADHRFMTWAQARALREGGFEVGAHTVNHPILSRLEPARAEQEMVDSRAAIRREVGVCSEVFCYPNGKAGDYTPAIMALSARHFQAALATNRGPARVNERYQLRRIGVANATTLHDLAVVLLRER